MQLGLTLIVSKYEQNQMCFVFLSFRVPRMTKDDREKSFTLSSALTTKVRLCDYDITPQS